MPRLLVFWRVNSDAIFGRLKRILLNIDQAISALNAIKTNIANTGTYNCTDRTTFIVNMQNELQMKRGKNKMIWDCSTVPNTKKTFELILAIIDYALNICYRTVSFQQLKDFASDIDLKISTTLMIKDTIYDRSIMLINTYFKGDVLA
jgi:hypothetical protein